MQGPLRLQKVKQTVSEALVQVELLIKVEGKVEKIEGAEAEAEYSVSSVGEVKATEGMPMEGDAFSWSPHYMAHFKHSSVALHSHDCALLPRSVYAFNSGG